ncbi:hypothetical protein [Mycobacterium sp.]|uniref:hypothetical protein n=1 Tax=Mycobacterium sp. TaxID=1785 RepID=UPI0025EBCBE8|nr:hypothetical protein [Mycobacterium sp.]
MVDDPRVRVVFLPRPRRSRHPYQWGCAAGLLVYALANIIVGPASHSPLLIVGNRDNEWLNYFLLFGAVNLLVATVIPDNYWRLFVELFGHLSLVFSAGMFGLVAGQSFLLVAARPDEQNGLSMNLCMATAILVAAGFRCREIWKTLRGTYFKPKQLGKIVELDDTLGGSS